MGIAFSPPDRVVLADIDASTSACFRNGLHLAALKAGWTVDRTVTNGYVYVLTSPQDGTLQCKLLVQDTGRSIWPPATGGVIDFTFLTMDEDPAYSSLPYAIRWGNWYTYGQPTRRLRFHLAPCQMFSYFRGVDAPANAVMGGVPYIDPNALESTLERCADDGSEEKTWRAVWSSSDTNGSFRSGYTCGEYCVVHNSGVIRENTGLFNPPRLRLIPVNRPDGFWAGFGTANFNTPLMMRWMGSEEPLLFDAFIAWSSGFQPFRIRGTLWDAFCRAKFATWESPFVLEDIPFFSYTSGYAAGYPPHWYQAGDILTLYLRDPGVTVYNCDGEPPPVPEESNYVY